MGNRGRDPYDGATTDGDRSVFGWIERRLERCDFTPKEIDSIFNCILTIVVLCAVMSLCFMTFSLHRHIISLIFIPILAYIIFSSPGFNLRLREYKSMLIMTDLMALIEIFGLCLYMDHLYATHASDLLFKVMMCMVGALVLTAYLCRVKVMFYLSLPFVTVYNMLMVIGLGCTEYEALALGGFLVMVFAWALYSNSFYFGIGRVCLEGVYVHMPEEEARYVRKVQRMMERERKERLEAELERRRKLQRQGLR